MEDESSKPLEFDSFFEFKNGTIGIKEGVDTSFATKLLVERVNATAKSQSVEAVKDVILQATISTVANIKLILDNYENLIKEINRAVVEHVSHDN